MKNIDDLQKKMKALQKHQAFEAEIMANKDLIENVGKVVIFLAAIYISVLDIIISKLDY